MQLRSDTTVISRDYVRARLLAAIVTSFALLVFPSTALEWLGYSYSGEGGLFLMKIHPSTYIALAFLGFLLAVDLREGAGVPSYIPQPVLLYGICLGVTISFTIIYNGLVNVSFLVDTLLMPAIVAILLAQLTQKQRAVFFPWIVGFMTFNAVIAMIEAVTGWRMLPYMVQGVELIYDTRSTAMMGHALQGSLMMAITIFGVLAVPERWWWRLPAIGLMFAGMLAFGGRSSLVLLILLFMIYQWRTTADLLTGARFRMATAVLVITLLLFLPIILTYLFAGTSFGQSMIERLTWDGSAQTRLVALDVFGLMTIEQFFLGVSAQIFDKLIILLQLPWTIEIAWIALLVRLGLIFFIVYMIGLVWGLGRYIWTGTHRAIKFGLVFFVLVMTTYIGIGAKTLVMTMAVLIFTTARAYTAEAHLLARQLQAARLAATRPLDPAAAGL